MRVIKMLVLSKDETGELAIITDVFHEIAQILPDWARRTLDRQKEPFAVLPPIEPNTPISMRSIEILFEVVDDAIKVIETMPTSDVWNLRTGQLYQCREIFQNWKIALMQKHAEVF